MRYMSKLFLLLAATVLPLCVASAQTPDSLSVRDSVEAVM